METELKPLDLTHNGKREDTQEPTKKSKKLNLKQLREKHAKPVRGIFRYHECPGGLMKFSFMEFKEDGVKDYALQDGEVYTIPLGVALHLNKNVAYPEYDYFKTEDKMKNTFQVARKVRRVSFQSLEFIDEEEFNSPDRILQVTSAF
ncbi:MAG: hypothetical protein ACHQVS_00530 [Candidatus Babeliales bacterium]